MAWHFGKILILNHDVLFLIMKQLGVVDFLAFSGVCKSWRSFAASHKKMFMESLPPMPMRISINDFKDSYCHLKDFEGRSFKTILPHSAGRIYFGLTCGYLVFGGRFTHEFFLVNPITRHELHFPDYPLELGGFEEETSAMLVFSPSISGWVFVVLHRNFRHNPHKAKLLYHIAGKRGWNHLSSSLPIIDLHVFKGKIYTLHTDSSLGELRLNLMQKRKWTILKTSNSLNIDWYSPRLVSTGENLYLIDSYSLPKQFLKLDFGEMKWVSQENTLGEYGIFFSLGGSSAIHSAAIKSKAWVGSRTRYKSYYYYIDDDDEKVRKHMIYYQRMWYFPDDCLDGNVNLLDE